MNMLLCEIFWTDVFPDLWWGLVVAVTVLGALAIVRPLIQSYINLKSSILKEQYQHEEKMRADAFDRELKWHIIKSTDKPIEKELDKCKKELEELRKKEKELNDGTESLKKEKEQFYMKVLNTKIKVYEEIVKKINK